MGAMLVLGLMGLGAPEVSVDDRSRLEAVKKSLATWRSRVDTCDVYYWLERLDTPAGLGRLPWFPLLVEPVRYRTTARLTRSGDKRLYSSGGQILCDGVPRNHRREVSFDGQHTLSWYGDDEVHLDRGRNVARGVATPTGVVGIDCLCEHLLGDADPALSQITVNPRGSGWLEIALVWPSLVYEFVVEAEKPYVISSMQVYSGDEVLSEVSGIQYHEFPGGILYPVKGTMTTYERGTGELAEQETFEVDTERTRIDPPGGIPEEVFRVTIPEGAVVIDNDTGLPVSAEEKEILLAPGCLRETKIELPTSRPTQPPETRPSGA